MLKKSIFLLLLINSFAFSSCPDGQELKVDSYVKRVMHKSGNTESHCNSNRQTYLSNSKYSTTSCTYSSTLGWNFKVTYYLVIRTCHDIDDGHVEPERPSYIKPETNETCVLGLDGRYTCSCSSNQDYKIGVCTNLGAGETGFDNDGAPICGDGYEITIINGESFCTPKQEKPDNSYCGSRQNALNILGNICKSGVNSSTIAPDTNGCYNSLSYSCDNGEIGTVEITQDFKTGTGDSGGTSPTSPTDPDTSTGTGGTTTDPTNPNPDTGTSTGGSTGSIDPTNPDDDRTPATAGTGTSTGGGSTGEVDEPVTDHTFPNDEIVPEPVDTLPEGNTASNCDETQLTLTEMLLCEMNDNLEDTDGTFPTAVDDLKKSNNEAYKAMNNNLIGSNKRLDELIKLERNSLQAENKSNSLLTDVKDLLTPPADGGKSELDKLDTILDDETNFSEDVELTSDLKNTANGYFENYSNIFKNQLLDLFSTFFSINTSGATALGVPYNFTLAGRNFTGVFLDEEMFKQLHMDKLAKIIIFGFSVLGFLHAFRFVISSKDN
ncbi:hypothetical protein ACH5BF_02120 [Arcobacter sp. YIC-464]|uniref:hypothetical protein n=1 Tax=Arcobacter sp. YIC-464 TaxID=3376631 RepID=UPI003C1AC991